MSADKTALIARALRLPLEPLDPRRPRGPRGRRPSSDGAAVKREAEGGQGRDGRLASLGVALLAFALLTAIAVVIFRGISERDHAREPQRRRADDEPPPREPARPRGFGSAIEGVEALRKKVVGVGAYAENGSRLYSWGATPETFSWTRPKGASRAR